MLKDQLVDTFGLSKRELATRLLNFRLLGDTKPSVMMDEMLALLGDHPPCLFFEQLYLERLPEDIRIQLVNTKIKDNRQLAKQANALWASRIIRCKCHTKAPTYQTITHQAQNHWGYP